MGNEPDIDPKILDDPIFQQLMEEGLAIQDRFAAEPVYAKTGEGYLKSAGVSELAEAKRKRKEGESSSSIRVAEGDE